MNKEKNWSETIEVKGLGQLESVQDLFEKLGDKYGGQWVAILRDGTVVAHSDLAALYDAAGKPESVAVLFRAPKKGQQYFLRGVKTPPPPWSTLTTRQKAARVLDYFTYV